MKYAISAKPKLRYKVTTKKPRKKKEPNIKSFLINQLRRVSFKWKPRGEAMKAARVARGKYECNICKEIFGNKEIVLDHIQPVVPVDGWDNWDGYIERLFCQIEGYQCICKICHDNKTEEENKQRVENRKDKRGDDI